MPDGGGAGEGGRPDAVGRVARFLLSLTPGANTLSRAELTGYRAYGAVAGWRVPLEFDGVGPRELDVVVDAAFPHSFPQIFLRSPPPALTWTHVEGDGRLCIWPDHDAIDREDPCSVLRILLGEACELVESLARGERAEDFREEFLSYWARFVRPGARQVVSLLQPHGPTRLVHVAPLRGGRLVVADDSAELGIWLQRAGTLGSREPGRGVLACLPTPMMPGDYPRKVSGLVALLHAQAPEALEMLRQVAAETPPYLTVVLASAAADGPCLAAVTLLRRALVTFPGSRRKDRLIEGFREGKVPEGVARDRYLGQCSLEASIVERADHGWVHGRGQNRQSETLRHARVAVLGCGSVGSAVAMRLAEVGVGHLLLVDPQALASANVGRHVLGMGSLFQAKAAALAAAILSRFPHIGSVRHVTARCQNFLSSGGGGLTSFDLIISAMGDWPGEASLNDWHLAVGRRLPVLYAWTEAHACAGHAVLVAQQGGCLRCGMGADLRPRVQVTQWPEGLSTLQSEPACGAAFQPYGPVELGYITTMASEMALDALLSPPSASAHRVWTAPRRRLQASGGAWTEGWLGAGPSREPGGAIHELEWPAARCPACAT